MSQIHILENRLVSFRTPLLEHPIYDEINRLEALSEFMSQHVFAVWDFMSLLRVLQLRICKIDLPWLPPANLEGIRFINEIVLAEESDEDGRGGFASHFELYYRAMKQCGASTVAIDGFLNDLRQGVGISRALDSARMPKAAVQFVRSTFNVIENGDLCEIAAVFTFGREDLLPDVFQQIVEKLNKDSGGTLDQFKYYLERHIELDGDNHGPMASRLLESICGDDKARWEKAEKAAVDCLIARRELWDGIHSAIKRHVFADGACNRF